LTNPHYYSTLVFPTIISSEHSSSAALMQSFTVYILPNTLWAMELIQQVKDNEIRTMELNKRNKSSSQGKKGKRNKKNKDLVVMDIQEPTRPFDFHVMVTRVKRSYLSKDIEPYRCFLFLSFFNNSVSLQMMINHLLYIYGTKGGDSVDKNNMDTRPIWIFFYWRVNEDEETVKQYKLLGISFEQMQFLHFSPHLINPHFLKKRKKFNTTNNRVNFDARLYLDNVKKLRPTEKKMKQYCLENNPEYPHLMLPKQHYSMNTSVKNDNSVARIITDVAEIALVHEIPKVAVILSSYNPAHTEPVLTKLQENQTLTVKFHLYEEYV
jgi:hypothetical protein